MAQKSSKNRDNAAAEQGMGDADGGQVQGEMTNEGSAMGGASASGENHVLIYRRDHPQNRSSYGIAGVAGIVVFDKGLFADGVPPASITLDCLLALPQLDNKTAKAEAAAQKVVAKAEKEADKVKKAQLKAAERQAKADKALADAKAKAEAAAAKAQAAKDAPPVEQAAGVEGIPTA